MSLSVASNWLWNFGIGTMKFFPANSSADHGCHYRIRNAIPGRPYDYWYQWCQDCQLGRESVLHLGFDLYWMLHLYVSSNLLSSGCCWPSALSFYLCSYFFIPETRGLSLEQIDLLYRESSSTCITFGRVSSIWPCFLVVNSDKYRRQMLEEGETYVQKKKVRDNGFMLNLRFPYYFSYRVVMWRRRKYSPTCCYGLHYYVTFSHVILIIISHHLSSCPPS
jgi:hypothetical protein